MIRKQVYDQIEQLWERLLTIELPRAYWSQVFMQIDNESQDLIHEQILEEFK
jgi:hypothetical protein